MANLGLKERYDFQQWIIKDLKEKMVIASGMLLSTILD